MYTLIFTNRAFQSMQLCTHKYAAAVSIHPEFHARLATDSLQDQDGGALHIDSTADSRRNMTQDQPDTGIGL